MDKAGMQSGCYLFFASKISRLASNTSQFRIKRDHCLNRRLSLYTVAQRCWIRRLLRGKGTRGVSENENENEKGAGNVRSIRSSLELPEHSELAMAVWIVTEQLCSDCSSCSVFRSILPHSCFLVQLGS
jgi:hypothetical protein